MTEAEQQAFFERGKNTIGNLAQIVDQLRTYAAVFEARGGADALGDYGGETLHIIYLHNDLDQFLTPERRATLAKLRTDY